MAWLLAALSLFLFPTLPASASDATHPLSESERSALRYKLENLFNEMDLLIRNQRVDRSDLQRQKRDFEGLRVFERIPFETDLTGIRKSLSASAKEHGIRVLSIAIEGRSRPDSPVPRSISTDGPRFRFSEDQLIERLHLRIKAAGKLPDLERWMDGWLEEQPRLVESQSIRKSGSSWVLHADAFRFRTVKFPTLKPRDPWELLPSWARKAPSRFAEEEPMLWSFVTRIQALRPKALPLYRSKEEFLLNHARMDLFISKVVAPDAQQRKLGRYASGTNQHPGRGRRALHAHAD